MSRILLIGNSGNKKHGTDGQTVKVRLYYKKIKDEGFDVDFVDLENFSKKPIRTLLSIKKYLKTCSRIVLLTAERGSKILIPFINFINRKYKKQLVFPLIGISVLHTTIDNMSEENKIDFLVNGNYSLSKPDKKLVKQLKKIDYILPETLLLTKAFTNFYGLNNVYQLNNFREEKQISQAGSNSNSLRLVYVSRVMAIKGIFDILPVVKELNNEGFDVVLDIYGNKKLSEEESTTFDSYLDKDHIKYKGTIDYNSVTETIANYDLFVFPTRYYGEGTPGVIAESLIAGVPIITSDFPQAKYILKNGFDSIFYKMTDIKELKDIIINIIRNKDKLIKMKANAYTSGKEYTYNHERKAFLRYICGIGEE